MNVPCRCRRCETRRTLSKHPDEYVRPPKCRNCGSPITYVCADRRSKRDKRNHQCGCSGYHFTHRRGSKWCHKNPGIDELLQETRA